MEHLAEAQAVMRENGFGDAPRPWIREAAKAVHENGPFADYAGWERWMGAQLDRPCPSWCEREKGGHQCHYCDIAAWWEDSDSIERAELYAIMANACDETAKAMGWKDTRD